MTVETTVEYHSNLCPQCHVNRTEIQKSLEAGLTPENLDNFNIAEKIIGSCTLCSARFNGLLKKMGG